MKTKAMKQMMMTVVAIVALLPVRSVAASATLGIEDFAIKQGETKEMLIDVNNANMQVTMVEFYMQLPSGLSVATENGELAVDIAGRTTWKKHSLEASLTDGAVHFFLYSGSNAVLTGTGGAVISVKLTASSSFTGGNIVFERQLITSPDETECKPDNYIYKVEANVDSEDEIIAFTDANVKRICVTNWDTNGDGELSKTEAAAVTDLGTVFNNNKTISSFEELCYFIGLTSIGSSAFERCTSLSSITIPNSVTNIGYTAFQGCSSLTSVTIGNSVTSMGEGVFSGCTSLSSITIPNNVQSIRYMAFYGCTSLTSVTIGNSVTSIESEVFSGCSKLTSIIIPNSVTTIGNNVFKGCSSLTSITIPNSVTKIGDNVFQGCSVLSSIIVDDNNTIYDSRNNCNAIIETRKNELIEGCFNTTIPKSVTSIRYYAFSSCSGLTSITIPSSVMYIGSYAFYGCDNLTSVEAEMPNPVAITQDVFSNRANATLYVMQGCKAGYMAADYWKEFKEIIEIGSDDEPSDIEVTDISVIGNVIYMDETEVRTGTQSTLSLKMKNTTAIRGFQFDLYLPEGVTAVKSAKGKIQGVLSGRRLPSEDEHTLTLSEQPDGVIRFLCSSQYEETFTGSDGEIATLLVDVADDMKDGDYAIQLKNIKLTENDISKFYLTDQVIQKLAVSTYIVGDISGDGMVDVSDYTGVANHIHGKTPTGFNAKAADVNFDNAVDVSDYTGIANIIHTGSVYGTNRARLAMSPNGGQLDVTDVSCIDNVIYITPFSAAAGSEEYAVSIKMKNTADIRGFQFDLYLPEGVTAVKSTKGRIQGVLNAERLPDEDEHELTLSEQPDGAIRFLCSSLYEETFTGNDGEIATLKVSIASDMPIGEHAVVLKNVKLTENNISMFYLTEQVNTTMTIDGDETGISLNKCNTTTNSLWYTLDGRKLDKKPTAKGVYVRDNRKIVVK